MSKEAIAIVIDVARVLHNDASAITKSIECVKQLLVRKLLSESRDQVCLVLSGTSGTDNELARGDHKSKLSFEHITLSDEVNDITWSLVDRVRALTSSAESSKPADVFGAIQVAFNHLQSATGGRRDIALRNIAVFSHAQHTVTERCLAEVEQLANELNEKECILTWIHPNTINAAVSTFVNSITSGTVMMQDDVIGMVRRYQTRQPRATAWKVNLEVGTVDNRNRVVIPVCGYVKIREAKQKTMQSVLASNPDVAVKNERTFYNPDAAVPKDAMKLDANDAEGGRDDQADRTLGIISASNIEFAYRFGGDLVVISDAEYQNLRYRVDSKCLQIIKVVPRTSLPFSLLTGDSGSMMIVGDPASTEAQRALSALVCALEEADACAIVRKCYSKASMPRLFVLAPRRSRKHDKLICIGLPFGDDIRPFHFESLPYDESVLQDKPYLHRVAPNDEQRQMVDELVAASVAFGEQHEAAFDYSSIQNPYLQRFLEACEAKAGGDLARKDDYGIRIGTDALLDGGQNNTAWRTMFERAADFALLKSDLLTRVSESFSLKRVAKANLREKPTGYSMFLGRVDVELNVPSQIEEQTPTALDDTTLQIGSVSAVRDFIKLARADRDELIIKAFSGMRMRIEEFLSDEFAQPYYPKIVECLNVLRSESIKADPEFEQGRLFNDLMERIKNQVAKSSSLREFWQLARDSKLTLIKQSDIPIASGYNLASDEDVATLYNILDTAIDLDLLAAKKQQAMEVEDDFDPFAEVSWNC